MILGKTRFCIMTLVIYAISPLHYLWCWCEYRLTKGYVPFVGGLAMYYAELYSVATLVKEEIW